MRILVIGSSGQLARSLVAAQEAAAVEVIAIGRPEVDLAVPQTLARAFDRYVPELVVNAAAYTAVDQAEKEPDLAHAINGMGAGNVAGACQRYNVPIIHVSTDYVFDGCKPQPYDETDNTAPLGVYGHSKLAGERRVAALSTRHVILRTSWLVSPYGRNFVRTMLRLADTRPQIDVVNDQLGTPTFAPHLAQCVLAIGGRLVDCDRDTAPWGIYHAAGAGEATWCDLAREVFVQAARLNGPSAEVRPITTAEYPTPARRPANSRLDCRKLAHIFGVRLPDWRNGIAECVRLLST